MADLEARVLIVDDEKHDIELVEKALSPIRLRILKLTEPRDVLQKVENESPDVVILDALLPGMSGFDLCREIKSAPGSKKTAVLILTGVYLRDHYRREAIHQFKADGFLTKPFRARELQRTFLKVLARKLRMSPRKVQEELAANQDILLPSELEEKSGWLGRIFGKLRPSSEPSVSPGFLHAAEKSEPAPVDPDEPIEASKPVEAIEPIEPIEENKPTVEGDESTKPEATAEEKGGGETAPATLAADGPKADEREVEEEIVEEQGPEEPGELEETEEPEEALEAEKKPEPEDQVEPEEKSITEKPPVLVETSERNVEKVEDGGLPDVVAGEETALEVASEPEGDVEPGETPEAERVEPIEFGPLEVDARYTEVPADTPEDTIDEAVQGHLSSVWDDLPVGEPEEIPSEIDTAEPEVVVDAESASPEPEVVVEAGVGPEPEAVIEAETESPEPVVPEPAPEPPPEIEPTLDSVPIVQGEAVSEPEPAPEKPLEEPPDELPEIDAEAKPVDLDSARALFEALEGEGLEAEEAAKVASADPARTMPAIDPAITEKLRAATKRRKEEPETPVEEAPTEKPAAEDVNEVAEKPGAGRSEAPPVAVDAEAISQTTEEPVVQVPEVAAEVAAEPQPAVVSNPEKAVDGEATPEAAPDAVTEIAAREPEPTAEPVAKPVTQPEAEPVTKPMAKPKPIPVPAVETDEEPPLDVPRELAIYREPEFRRELKRELSKCRRVERPLTLVLVRITDLGQIVEIFGRTYRPKVLLHVAEQVLGALRDVDSVGLLESQELLALAAFASDRYGGERIIARLRKALRSHPFDVGLGIAGFVPKLLFGMASFPKDADTVEELLLHAEKEIAAE